MNEARALVAVAVLAFGRAPGAEAPALDARVAAALAGFPGQASLYARNLDTGRDYGRGADDRVRAASTIKLAILVAAHTEVAAGRARWDDTLVLTDARKAAGAGVLPEMSDGHRLTLREAVNLMIVVSDNTATNLVLDHLSSDRVNSALEALGLPATRSLRKIGGGGESRAADRAESQGFGIGVTTPREMVQLLALIARGEAVSSAASAEMRALLERQQYRDGLFRGLRGLSTANKPGALDHLRSDVGIAYTPKGRIAMAITLDGLPSVDYSVDNPGLLLLSRLSALLVEGLQEGGAGSEIVEPRR